MFKGYSVYPKEVEELLMKHPDISEAAVAGLPSKETGEFVKAWIELIEGSKLTIENITEWIKNNMAHYKRPSMIEIINDIPKSIVGKVQRRELQINNPIWKETYNTKN